MPDTPTTLHQLGATTIILHQSNRLNPYTDWPSAPSVMPMLADYVVTRTDISEIWAASAR